MSPGRSSVPLYFAVVLSALAIAAVDLLVPLGIAVWILFFVPIALSKFDTRPNAPLWAATFCSILLLVTYQLDSGQQDREEARYVPYNRSFGFVTMWLAAAIGRRFILTRLSVQREAWFTAAQTGLSMRMQGEQSHAQLGDNILRFVADYLGAHVGAIYLAEADGSYHRFASFALDASLAGPDVVRPGEGLIGQAARDDRPLTVENVPERYLDVRSGLGRSAPQELVIVPAALDGKVQAVLELGFLNGARADTRDLLERLRESIASAVRSVNYRTRQRELLIQTQEQAEALQAQQEELRVQNEELEQQSHTLQESQARLENQQVELEQINTQLEEQASAAERERDALARAQRELERANQYKSEFLANMSHELRTPLNSALILAKLLVENRPGNLLPDQIKFAETIYSAGNDLLTLINDILDLSKIEAGKLDVRVENVAVTRVVDQLMDTFRPIARERQLELTTDIEASMPGLIATDVTRLQQILKNLISNALKFTDRGGVSLSACALSGERIRFDVRDTGIGIPVEHQEVIFEAFRQADGTTNRKYGGTGLGLSISRDLARLLGGRLSVTSVPGRGSTFSLVLPVRLHSSEPWPAKQPQAPAAPSSTRDEPTRRAARASTTERDRLAPNVRSILIIEDDPKFACILEDLARELDFQTSWAASAEEGLSLAEQHRPSAIVLDMGLPDRSGLSVLDSLKHNPATRHIPVHVVSVSDYTQVALEMGAAGYAIKPVQREQLIEALQRLEAKFTQKLRRVLVVEDDPVHRDSTCQLLAADDVQCESVGTAAEALEKLGSATFDCMVLDLSLPDRSGFDLLDEMAQQERYAFPPVIVYTGRSLSRDEEQRLRRNSQSIIVKGARSPERLLDEVTLFLHKVESDLPPDRQRMLRDARHREAVFEGKRVLVVEDDVRNIFALSSVLEPKGAKVEIARNGCEALRHLAEKPGVDLVLMDIMMPEMDGIEATRAIRRQPDLAKLPIIALTAKAMADDRESCLAAGANDYIAKPLDVDRLLSLARVWMRK